MRLRTASRTLILKGAIDFRAHSSPDSMDRSIDADDLARLAKEAGMRGLVLMHHWESTAALAYTVRKLVPGIEVFGGVVLDKSVGGINLDAVQRMALMKGGYGRVVWFPTADGEAFMNYFKVPGLPLPSRRTAICFPRCWKYSTSSRRTINWCSRPGTSRTRTR